MLKFLLITIIIIYLLFKVGGYLFRIFYLAMGGEQRQQFNKTTQKKKEGDINIDYVPNDKKGGKKNFNGGEYIDFEEVD